MNAPAMKTTTIQLDCKLLDQLKAIAASEGRSLASQVRIFLAASVTRKNTAKRGKSKHAA